jgi:hypothetical protein
VSEYNTDRPHQSLGRLTPAERFATRVSDLGPVLRLDAVAERRGGGGGGGGDDDDWVSRRVASNGVICVAWQPFSVGKHRGGELVDVHVTQRLLQVWSGDQLIKTIVRTSKGDVRKKRASRPANLS